MRITESTLNQPYVFAAFMYAGMLAGILYSVFKVLRKAFGGGKVVTILTDIVFLCLLAAFSLYVMYLITDIDFRIYHVVGLFLGFVLYTSAINPFLSFIERKIVHKKNSWETVDKLPKN